MTLFNAIEKQIKE